MENSEVVSEAELAGMVASMPVFQGLDDADIIAITQRLERLRFADGTRILYEGEPGTALFLLLEGELVVSKSQDGQETVLSELKPGSYFGEFALLDRGPRSADVTARGDVEVAMLDADEFEPLLAGRAPMAAAFYRNCLVGTFERFREITAHFTSTQTALKSTSATLASLNGDLARARSVQENFLRSDAAAASSAGLRITTWYQPCDEVGGDHLDAVAVAPGAALAFVADVTGHGVSAALATGVIKSALLTAAETHARQPARLLESINRHYTRVLCDLYATAYAVLVDVPGRQAVFSKAGHPAPLVFRRRTGEVHAPGLRGICLGLDPDAAFETFRIELEPGDKVLLFTDGLLEQTLENGEEFGENRWRFCFQEACLEGSADTMKILQDKFWKFVGKKRQQDDLSAILMEADA